MRFPAATPDDPSSVNSLVMPSPAPLLDPVTEGFEVAVGGRMEVRSGHHGGFELLVTNRRPASLSVVHPTAAQVLERETGEIVGACPLPVALALRVTTAAPGATVKVPFGVGTASLRRSLGYAVPPGHWAVEVDACGQRVVLPLQVLA